MCKQWKCKMVKLYIYINNNHLYLKNVLWKKLLKSYLTYRKMDVNKFSVLLYILLYTV